MGLRYYLRGLGIGIFVTAIVLSATKPAAKAEMTDSEVIARAKVLGMVEKETLADAAKKTDEKADVKAEEKAAGKPDSSAEEKAQNETDTKAEAKSEAKAETPAKEPDKKEEAVKAVPDKKETKPEQKADTKPETKPEQKAEQKPATTVTSDTSTIIIAVYPGEGSYTVSKKLATQGLVESADKFDNFLCQNGYDKKICTGNYEIKVGAGAEEIARALTRGV